MAAKRTSDIVPMCHPLMLTGIDIRFELNEELPAVEIRAEVKCRGVTGVEMEALTAVSAAALTVYDMCKAVQKDMVIERICLLSKRGRQERRHRSGGIMEYRAAVITMSDKGSQGLREDTAGDAVVAILEENGWNVDYRTMIPDDMEQIKEELIKCADELNVTLTVTTGGTGFSMRDVTPEATLAVVDREVRGIPEAHARREHEDNADGYAVESGGRTEKTYADN